ncbi:MAG: type sorting protein [Ferruginibacter sp.]|nr:type sorting protein [Ferruginibacter sp.]
MANGTSINGSGILTISGTSSTALATGFATISCPIIISSNTTFSPSNGATLTINGSVSGTGGFYKSGSGILRLEPTSSATLSTMTILDGYSYLGGNITVNGILDLTSGTLNISSGTLNAIGGITRTAGFLAGDGTGNLTLGGTTSEPLYFETGQEILNTLTLNHSAPATTTLFTDLVIYGNVNFASANDNFNVNGQHLTLKSSGSGTAYVGEIKGSLTNASNVTVERYIDSSLTSTGRRAWRLLSIPVTGQTIRNAWAGAAANPSAPNGETNYNIGTLITGHGYSDGTLAAAAGYDWFTGLGANTTSSIRYYDAAHAWASATNTPSTLSVPDKQGYMLYVRGDRSVATATDYGYTVLQPTGTLKQGTQTIPVNDAYTVVGNPYASPINLNAVYLNGSNGAVIKRNFWIWDATQGTSGAYRSLTWNGIDSYNMTGGSGSAADYLTVNSGQAFFVEKSSTGNITIQESNKTTTTAPTVFRPMGSTVSNLSIKLYQATGATLGLLCDGALARYNDLYNVSPWETYDAAKMNNFNENLSLVREGRYLSVESRPYPKQNDTLFVPFWGLKVRDYALTITSNNLDGLNQTAILYDAFTNVTKQVDMTSATVIYPFSVTSDPASSSLNRFKVIMAPAAFGVLPVKFTKIAAQLYDKKIQVAWLTANELGVTNYDVEKSADGLHFSKISTLKANNASVGGSYQVTDEQPFTGNNFYRIRSNDESGKTDYSSTALVQFNSKHVIHIMPSIITNQQFTISLKGQPAGNYNLSLTNLSGQQVYKKTIYNTNGDDHLIAFQKGAVSTGVYNLSVAGADGSIQNFRLLIKN